MEDEVFDDEVFDLVEVDRSISCGKCGGTEFLYEKVCGHEWVDDREVDFAYTVVTCLDCGESWMEEA